ncbi:hypothetical protein ADUPG1_006501 [Aduncisulcus paluster]|uniref:Uncharacterized protein n=1 Tax=Aduncisulcus paluster TaxID=2918883 RepID=A0ABQ5KN12_9EUKA|nr:hypothetical protein ADUPG1_006501 [Aduncisulcus paluster]
MKIYTQQYWHALHHEVTKKPHLRKFMICMCHERQYVGVRAIKQKEDEYDEGSEYSEYSESKSDAKDEIKRMRLDHAMARIHVRKRQAVAGIGVHGKGIYDEQEKEKK